jgi:tetratricopeptide (TPR) repeat protein
MSQDDFKELKKELSDTRNLMIKTDNMIMGLSAELKNIQKKQESYERKYIFNSVAAYVLFVMIIGTLTYLGFDNKYSYMKRDRDEIEKKLRETREELEGLTARLDRKGRVEREALEIYRALEAGRKEEALRGLSKINMEELSQFEQKILKDKISLLKSDLAHYSLEKSAEMLKMEDAKSALAELERGREYAEKAELANQFVIMMSQAHFKGRNPDKAIAVLEELVARTPKGPRLDQAVWNLATLNEAKGDRASARKYYTALVENFRESQLSKMAWRRLRQMERERAARQEAAQAQ